ncbi:MAG TPA: ribosome maturation factor RimP [Mycobacteriales bacterium]|nr:ribosome maturation factor RimP [Mycobacteriales bacterium]
MTPKGGAATTAASLRPLVEPVVEATGYDLEDVVVSSAGRRSVVRVVVDRDGGIDLDEVADVSRAVSDALDGAGVFGDAAYTLEVTSPGVDRPLTEPRHWRRNIGRLVKTDSFTGRIKDVTDDGVAVEVKGAEQFVPFGELGSGKVEIEFRRDGADA